MVDSEALRTRRHRQHRRGDHSLCLPGNCDYVPTGPPEFQMPQAGSSETVTDAVLAFVESIPPGSDAGPQLVLARCALKLARAIDADVSGLPGHVRELSAVMSALRETADGEDQVSELQARRAARRVALLADGA